MNQKITWTRDHMNQGITRTMGSHEQKDYKNHGITWTKGLHEPEDYMYQKITLNQKITQTRGSHDPEDHMNQKNTWTRRSHELEYHMKKRITWTKESHISVFVVYFWIILKIINTIFFANADYFKLLHIKTYNVWISWTLIWENDPKKYKGNCTSLLISILYLMWDFEPQDLNHIDN